MIELASTYSASPSGYVITALLGILISIAGFGFKYVISELADHNDEIAKAREDIAEIKGTINGRQKRGQW